MPLHIKDFYERPEDFIRLCTTAIIKNPWHTRTAMGNGGVLDTCHDTWLETVCLKPPPEDIAFSTAVYNKTRWTILRLRKKENEQVPVDNESSIPEQPVEYDLGGLIDQKEIAEKLMGTLDGRSKAVIKMRFGFRDGENPLTYSEAGLKLKITRERVRQIESKAIKKMARHAERMSNPFS